MQFNSNHEPKLKHGAIKKIVRIKLLLLTKNRTGRYISIKTLNMLISLDDLMI